MTNKQKLLEFESRLENIFGEKAALIKRHLVRKNIQTFRINTNVAEESNVLASLIAEGYKNIEKGPLPNSFIYKKLNNEDSLSKSKAYSLGTIYIQKLSSMLPAKILLKRQKWFKNLKILDLCAAPGSKTTQLAELTENKAEIIAVEKSRARYFKLKELIKKYKTKKVVVINLDGNLVLKKYPDFEEYFDLVLLDAPCSNEASLQIDDLTTFATWNKKQAKGLSKLQKGLINSAFKMLKPEGKMVYSTCTFSFEENEKVVDWFLKKNQQAELEKIQLDIQNKVYGRSEYSSRRVSSQIRKTARILPNKEFSGFYLALISKSINDL